MNKTFSQLLDVIAADVIATDGDLTTVISAPVVESALDVQPGGVFVARKGLLTDGHQYIPQAIENGAAAIVGQHDLKGLAVPYAQVTEPQQLMGHLAAAYHDFPSRKLTVIGVTGTNGKTTTSTLIHSILDAATVGKAGYISTLAANLGSATADTGLHVTTPTVPQVQDYLAQMVDNGLTHCVLEMTSHGLAQGRLNGVDVDVAVLTNVTHEHLDYHGSFENYRSAKARLFEMLMQSERKYGQPKISVINADDANAPFFAAIPADQKVTFGTAAGADYHIVDVDYQPDQTRFAVKSQQWQQPVEFTSALVGPFNVMNCVAAITVTASLNCTVDQIQDGIAAITSISGRMQRIDEGQDFTAVVDFAHTPDALEKALQAARTAVQPGGRLIAVFGSAGLRDVEKRRLMPEIAARLADFTVLTAEDPRTESLDAILQTMTDACISQGGVEGQTFIRVADRGEALYQACLLAKPGDVVIACGKGHEQSMCFGTTEYPWDDREAMRAALRGHPIRSLPTAAEG